MPETPAWGHRAAHFQSRRSPVWEHPLLSVADRILLEDFRAVALSDLHRRRHRFHGGQVKADLIRENVLLLGNQIGLLDFDDGGWRFRIFDLAATLLNFLE